MEAKSGEFLRFHYQKGNRAKTEVKVYLALTLSFLSMPGVFVACIMLIVLTGSQA